MADNTSPSPGYRIFTEEHFSVIREAQDIKRQTSLTLIMRRPGTNEINGHVLALTLLVAKNPGQMNTRQFQRLRLEENTLITEPLRDASGTPPAKAIRLKMIRVE